MRNKIRYTAEETTNNLYTSGQEWMLENFQEYVGSYHRYNDGLVLTGATYNPRISKKLIPYVDSINETKNQLYKKLKVIKTKYVKPIPYQPTIDPLSLKRDFINRYFLKHIDGTIIEISETQYTEWQQKKIDPNLYIGTKIEWRVSGSVADTKNGLITINGILSANQKSVQQAEVVMPNISNILTNYLEFAVNVTY